MAQTKPDFQIASILGGHGPTAYFMGEGQFLSSIGIDPDIQGPVTAFSRNTGAIAPSRYQTFSDSLVDDTPMWLITNPKNALIYTYLSDEAGATNSGALISYTSGFGSETDIGTPTAGAGNGANYYNNFIYLMTPTDVSSYGPLNNSPSITNTEWTGAGLGTQTALTNTTYPSYQSVEYPNHAGHVHTDDSLYFCDFVADGGAVATAGRGIIHKIKTKKTTNEGDTDDGSAYNVLDLPSGYYPTDIESYGTHLAVIAAQTTDTTLIQGKSAMFLWDTVADSFYAQIPIDDPFASAIYNRNGELHVCSGTGDTDGFNIKRYLGGFSWEDITSFTEGHTPFAGAVDGKNGRMIFGSDVDDPANAAVVYALGYKNPQLPRNATHSIARPSSGGANPILTCAKFIQQRSGEHPRIVMGWKSDTEFALDNLGGTTNAIFRSEIFVVGQPFNIDRIRIPLSEQVGANTSITVTIFYNRGNDSKVLPTINSTNYTSSERIISFKSEEIEQATTAGLIGQHDFFYHIAFGGTDQNQILLPMDTWITRLDDESIPPA